MKNRLCAFVISLLALTDLTAFGQRQELAISPMGLLYPKNQLIQYERYLDSRQSLTVSLGHNGDAIVSSFLYPPRTDRFTTTRGAIGYRYYFPIIGNEVSLFGSVRGVVDYSILRLQSDPRFSIPADSLRATGFSIGPELLAGGKITIAKRVTVSGAIGMQYLFKLFSTRQLTQNRGYWDSIYWTNDNQDWQYKRTIATSFRQSWYPSIQITVGAVLGKQSQAGISR